MEPTTFNSDSDDSSQLERSELYELGKQIFGSAQEFDKWLQTPFEGEQKKPIDLLDTTNGIGLVSNEITQIAYGDVV